ncbi:MAG TPA: hypothetical protein VK929_07800 [Longimicrobiales bacterium]|nr:hypothetical protein [Longimicrobiales bacterium]
MSDSQSQQQRRTSRRRNIAVLAVLPLLASACATAGGTGATAGGAVPAGPAVDMSTTAPSPDPRVGLRAGVTDAGTAAWNMRLVANRPSPEGFAGATNSDLAFSGDLVYQGNYNGFMVWDAANPRDPRLKVRYICPASQSDVSVYRNLLFVSGEGQSGRLDCGAQGVQDSVSHDRLRGIRIFDVTDIENPRYIHNVQTCRGSHTHTVVEDPRDPNNVYIYVSGSAGVRSPSELPGCSRLAPDEDPNSALFRIEVIRVPLANPAQAAIVTQPRIFEGLASPPRRDADGNPVVNPDRPGPSQCHDITVYPAVGLAGGACGGYGLLLDISDVVNPRRLDAAADHNMSFWHSATFSNDGSAVLFTDEWGGGSAPRCRETDRYEWGANALFTIENGRLVFQSYYKMPAAQTEQENCVAHNGSPIPIPGREIKVQAWYQGGLSIFDWTDPANPVEIAYWDRGPMSDERLISAGSWSSYWYNGYIYSSEIARGLDVYEIQPSGFISQNEIDAVKTVIWPEYNPQMQIRMEWPPSFPLARAYIDQLERSSGLSAQRIASARTELQRIERMSASQRVAPLQALATSLQQDVAGSRDAGKVRLLVGAVNDLAAAQR